MTYGKARRPFRRKDTGEQHERRRLTSPDLFCSRAYCVNPPEPGDDRCAEHVRRLNDANAD